MNIEETADYAKSVVARVCVNTEDGATAVTIVDTKVKPKIMKR